MLGRGSIIFGCIFVWLQVDGSIMAVGGGRGGGGGLAYKR